MENTHTPVHGWLLIDKPEGMTSARVVACVKRWTKQKVGHAGTLDPLATGVLPLAIGEATKTAGYVTCVDKGYQFSIRWGESRDTEDREGNVIATSNRIPTQAEIETVILDFIGCIEQVPPHFSAIKVDGKRAYDLARQGQEFTLKSRQVSVYSLSLIGYREDEVDLEVMCSKGTYVRSLSRDIACKLGVCGYVSNLRRIKLGAFGENDTISLDKCEELVHNGALGTALLPMDKLLDDIPVISVNEEQAKQLRFGQVIPTPADFPVLQQEQEVRVKLQGQLIAFGVCQGGMLKPKRIINQ